MAEFNEAFVTYLETKGLTIYPDFISQDESPPCVVYELISETPDYTLSGEQELKEAVYQFSAYGTTNAEALTIYKALKLAFKNYQGAMDSYYVQGIFIEAALGSDYDTVTGRHSYKVDYRFNYTEGA